MLCIHCGHWSDPADNRCSHCGRRVERSRPDTWQRSGLEPGRRAAAAAGEASAEMPPPEPQWKKQLDLKLETYRSRQKAGADGPVGAEAARGLAPLPEPSNKPSILSFDPGKRDSVAVEAPLPSPDTGAGAGWRAALERASPAPKLPPLHRPPEPVEALPERLTSRETARVESSETGLEDDDAYPRAAPIRLRAMAGLLDLTLVLIALGIFVGVLHALGGTIAPDEEGLRSLLFAFFGILTFYWIFYLRYIGETAGMHWLGLRVLDFNAELPDDRQRWARALGTILSTTALGLGFVWAMADEEHLTWHDRLSKTFVTRARPARRPTEASSRTLRQERPALTKAAHRA